MLTERGAGLKGGYFPYCQFCEHDGSCELKHNEFVGMAPGEPTQIPFDHEHIPSKMSSFQKGTGFGICPGSIVANNSIYYPLMCDSCPTVVNSLSMQEMTGTECAKFQPNEKGLERKTLAEQLAAEQGISLDKLDFELLPEPPPYSSVMKH